MSKKFRYVLALLLGGYAGCASLSANSQSLLSSEDKFVKAWQLQKDGALDAAFAAYEDAEHSAVLRNQRRKILRAIGEVGTRSGAPVVQRSRGYVAFEEAALLQDGFSLGRLVEFQDRNIYRPVHLVELIPLYEERARQGSNTTAMLLGKLYEHGDTVGKSMDKALDWYKVAALGGSGQGAIKLVVHYASVGNDKEALRWLKTPHPEMTEAQLRARVSYIFLNGEDIPRNIPVARKWAVSVAKLDPVLSVQLLRKILDVEFDLETFDVLIATNAKVKGENRVSARQIRTMVEAQASDIQKKAFERLVALYKSGNLFAASIAASILFQKDGFANAQGVTMALEAAKGGELEGVALAVEAIAGLPADSAKRQEFFDAVRTSAEKGTVEAMLALANIYSVGGIVPQDAAASFSWKLRAATAGDAGGAFQAGMAYMSGNGVPENRAFAIKWLERAKSSGNKMAAGILQQISAKP